MADERFMTKGYENALITTGQVVSDCIVEPHASIVPIRFS